MQTNTIIFAIYPNTRGFGYAYMDGPRKLLDCGMATVKPADNRKNMKRIKKHLDYFKPTLLIVQDGNCKYTRTGRRIKRLLKSITTHAKKTGLPIKQYGREQIREVFAQFGAKTKYDISQLIVKEFTELEPKSPKKRKLWMAEDYHMAAFDAISLGLTYWYLEE